jgi:hypothetical protein
MISNAYLEQRPDFPRVTGRAGRVTWHGVARHICKVLRKLIFPWHFFVGTRYHLVTQGGALPT